MYCNTERLLLPLVLTLQGHLGQPFMGHHTTSPTHSSCSDSESILGAWILLTPPHHSPAPPQAKHIYPIGSFLQQ